MRRVKDEAYGGTMPSTGYNGDEDQGQMGTLAITLGPRPDTPWGAVPAGPATVPE